MSLPVMLLCLMGLAVVGLVVGIVNYKNICRRRLMTQPLNLELREIVERNVGIYLHLPEELKAQLAGRINVFMAEKNFEGCEGQIITNEIKVTIAAMACILLLNRTDECYPHLRNILVYPSSYVVNQPYNISDHVIEEDDDVCDGESWEEGTIILGWEQVLEEGRNYGTGQNVVFHEFAHQLDFDNGISDGIPSFNDKDSRRRFDHVFCRAFERFRKATHGGRCDVIDEYGAVDHAEFFAVATEAFFELPEELRHKHPDLYKVLKLYYCLDPCSWRDIKN